MSKATTGEPPASGRGYRQASKMDAVAALEERAAELERQVQVLTTANGQASGPVAAATPEGPDGQPAPGPVPEYEPVGWTDGRPLIRYAYEAGSPPPAVTPEVPAVPPVPGRVPDGGLADGGGQAGVPTA